MAVVLEEWSRLNGLIDCLQEAWLSKVCGARVLQLISGTIGQSDRVRIRSTFGNFSVSRSG